MLGGGVAMSYVFLLDRLRKNTQVHRKKSSGTGSPSIATSDQATCPAMSSLHVPPRVRVRCC